MKIERDFNVSKTEKDLGHADSQNQNVVPETSSNRSESRVEASSKTPQTELQTQELLHHEIRELRDLITDLNNKVCSLNSNNPIVENYKPDNKLTTREYALKKEWGYN